MRVVRVAVGPRVTLTSLTLINGEYLCPHSPMFALLVMRTAVRDYLPLIYPMYKPHFKRAMMHAWSSFGIYAMPSLNATRSIITLSYSRLSHDQSDIGSRRA